MIREEIMEAKASMDDIAGDFDRVNRLNLELYNAQASLEDLEKRNIIRRFLVHLLPASLISSILAQFLLIFGRLGYVLAELGQIVALALAVYYGVRFQNSPIYKPLFKKARARVQPLKNELREASQVIENHFIADRRIQIIPEIYRYPQAVDYFHQVISVGRASSLKEAMNLYDMELKHWAQQEHNRQMMAKQEEILAEIDSIRHDNAFLMAAMMSRD